MQTSAGKYSYNYDVADELTQQNTPTGSISCGYDANGSRILQQAGTVRTTYQWDPRNRLSSVTIPTGGRYTQLYRPDDMRLSESGPVGISTMIWSGRGGEGGSGGNGTMDVLGVVATQSGSPMQQVFAHSSGDSASGGAGIGLPLSLSPTPSLVRAMGSHADGAAINRAYHLDNQGGVLALTTATGSIEADYHTDSWGNVIAGTAADNPYVYLGGLGYWEDSSLSLNYIRARWQETTTGSWLSVDPVRSEPRYQYAHNSPTRLVDASGRQSVYPSGPSAATGGVTPATQGSLPATGPDGIRHQQPGIWQSATSIYGQMRDKGEEMLQTAPPLLSNLLPAPLELDIWGLPIPIPNVLGDLWWMWGVAIGLAEGLWWLSPFGTAWYIGWNIGQVINYALAGSGWGSFGRVLSTLWPNIGPLFNTRQKDLAPFQKGRILGNLIIIGLSLIDLFVNFGSVIVKLGGRIGNSLKSMMADLSDAAKQVRAKRAVVVPLDGTEDTLAQVNADFINKHVDRVSSEIDEDPDGAIIGSTGASIALRTVTVPHFDIKQVDLSDYVNVLRVFAKQSGMVKDVGKEFDFAAVQKAYKTRYNSPGAVSDPLYPLLSNIRSLELEEEAMQAWEAATGRQILRRPKTQMPNAKEAWPKLAAAEGLSSKANPEGIMDGYIFDAYAPNVSDAGKIMSNLKDVKYGTQANNFIVNLSDSKVAPSDLIRESEKWRGRMPRMSVMVVYKNHVLTEVRFTPIGE